MSVLSACQTAGLRLTGVKPSTVFSTTDRFSIELADAATAAALDIAKAHDWQKLLTKATLVGDATTTAFSLPSDYDRMPVKAGVYSTRSLAPLTPVSDVDEWLEMEIQPAVGPLGKWIILGGQFQIKPAMASGELAKFYYVSKNIITNETTQKSEFGADADEFKLSERLLTLGVIWKWRAQKRMDYAEDLANYNTALNEEIGRDKGARMIVVGRARTADGHELAYPRAITP